ALATLTALHQLRVWEILVISTLSGIAIAVESPARQAFVADLVGVDDLSNAIGWNSLVMNGSRVLGPAIGGIAIRYIGIAAIFYYNSFSFLSMIVALLLMRTAFTARSHRHPLTELREGLRFIRHSRSIMLILSLTALVATFVMNFSVLMPVIAHDIVHTGAEGLGWMWAAMGVGAVAGSMTVVTWSRSAVRGPLLLSSALLASASMAALAIGSALGPILLILLVVGWATGAFFAGANAAIQHRVTDAVRGRVLSVYTMIFAGSTPVGSLFVAAIASAGGTRLALAAAGGICLILALVVALPFLRSLVEPPPVQAPLRERAS
ncbi:MAG: MFS transporter, partial [Chloroflexota bacterium]